MDSTHISISIHISKHQVLPNLTFQGDPDLPRTAYILPHTCTLSTTEVHHISIQSLSARLEPSVGVILISIRTKDLFVEVNDICAHPYTAARGKKRPAMVAPEGGTCRGMDIPTLGWTRKPSLQQATK